MSHRSGRKLLVPIRHANGDISINVYYYNRTTKTPLKINENELKGTPIGVIEALIKMCFKKGYLDKSFIQKLVYWGFNEGLWPDKNTIVYGRL